MTTTADLVPCYAAASVREQWRAVEGVESQGQRDAAEALQVHIVTPGELITRDPSFMRGHGTHQTSEGLVANVAGVVERVNKLVIVRPLKSRYVPEIGDVVVARVLEVVVKKWRMDVNSKAGASLMLSAINLPGGVQRRRTAADELNIRAYFREGDLVSAEVQQFYQDGSIALHTRSLKYGKLVSGQLVIVSPALIRRAKTHFHLLPCGVHCILGSNGYCFLSPPPITTHAQFAFARPDDAAAASGDAGDAETLEVRCEQATPELRDRMARVRNALVALDRVFAVIYATTIVEVYQASIDLRISTAEMLLPENIVRITESVRSEASSAAAAGV